MGARGGTSLVESVNAEQTPNEDEADSERRLSQADTEALRATVEAITTYLTRLVPFLLGLFLSLCLRRWWAIRSMYLQRIFSCGVQLSFWLRMVLPSKAAWIGKRIERDFLLAHKLVYIAAGCVPESEMLKQLLEEGFVSASEHEQLGRRVKALPKSLGIPDQVFDFDFAMLPFFWSAHLIYRVFAFGNTTKGTHGVSIPPPVLVKMLGYCMDARTGVENILMVLSAPLPFPYVHLVCLLVHLSAVFHCVESGLYLAAQPELLWQEAAFELASVAAMNSLYNGLLCLAVVLWNPFGEDVVDFPQLLLHQQLRKSQAYATHFLDDDELLDKMILKTFTANIGTEHVPKKKNDDEDEHQHEHENQHEHEHEHDEGDDDDADDAD